MRNDTFIRKANMKDIFRINEIEKNIFREEAWSLNMIADELSIEEGKSTWVINSKGIIRGYYMIRTYNQECHLMNIATEKPYQRSGFANAMMQHLLKIYANNTAIYLEVKKGNFPAINLYLKIGFREIFERKNYFRDGSTALVMCLN